MIDIGANLTNPTFVNDYQAVLLRAKQAGVSKIIITGTNLKESQAALALCNNQQYQLFSTCGCHPHHAKDFAENDLKQFKKLLQHEKVKALGECGLDFNRNYSPKDKQLAVFKAQVELACETGTPLFLHQRDAHKEFCSMLKTYRADLGRIVVHCFTDGKKELDDYLEMDCYIGITGWLCDEKRGVALQQAVLSIPEARIMIETDAPYLLPRIKLQQSKELKPIGRRNEPAFLSIILQKLADLRGQDRDELAKKIFKNSKEFFNI